jgi:hypothetical protein
VLLNQVLEQQLQQPVPGLVHVSNISYQILTLWSKWPAPVHAEDQAASWALHNLPKQQGVWLVTDRSSPLAVVPSAARLMLALLRTSAAPDGRSSSSSSSSAARSGAAAATVSRLQVYKLVVCLGSIHAKAVLDAIAVYHGAAESRLSPGAQQLLDNPNQLQTLLLLQLGLTVQAEHQKQRGKTQLPEVAVAVAAAFQQSSSTQQQQRQRQQRQQSQVEPWHEQLLQSLGVPAGELRIAAQVATAASSSS